MLFGIPFSLIGTIFGAVTGFASKALAMRAEVKASERKHTLDSLTAASKANKSAVKDEIDLLNAKANFEKAASAADPHRSEARRYIAYAIVASMAFMVPAMVIWGDVTWFQINEFTDKKEGLFGLFSNSKHIITTVTSAGIPLLWLDGMLTVLGTTVAFYMGGSAAKFKNPYLK